MGLYVLTLPGVSGFQCGSESEGYDYEYCTITEHRFWMVASGVCDIIARSDDPFSEAFLGVRWGDKMSWEQGTMKHRGRL